MMKKENNLKRNEREKRKKLEVLKKKILPILKENNVKKAGIFGSFARGEDKKNSDIDILIEFKCVKSLLEIVRLEFLLAKILKRKIDLLTYKSIHPLLKERILKEEKRII